MEGSSSKLNNEKVDGDATAVHTTELGQDDIKPDLENQKQVAEQQDGLPAPIEIPDGGWMAWATVIGAYVVGFLLCDSVG